MDRMVYISIESYRWYKMSNLVIAGGQSVTDYDGEQLARLAFNSFTFGVNDSGLLWPCDVIVALDPDWIRDRQNEIKHIKKPVITRKWDILKDMGLDLIELANDIPWRLSGMVACKISDTLAATSGSKSYVIGMDHRAGHYYNDASDCSKVVELDIYASMGLTNTINMGVHSRISCWPKISKLPALRKAASSRVYKAAALGWVRGEVEKGTFNK